MVAAIELERLEAATKIKVDVGVLQNQVSTLTTLCNKMDTIIDKLVDQHGTHLAKVYEDMNKQRLETEDDVKEIHERIDVVLDKLQSSELRIMEEIKGLRNWMIAQTKEEKDTLDMLIQWKWMIAGGIFVISWLFSKVDFDIIHHLIK